MKGVAVIQEPRPPQSIDRWFILNNLFQGHLEATVGGDWVVLDLRSGVKGKARLQLSGGVDAMTENVAHLKALVAVLETAVERARKP